MPVPAVLWDIEWDHHEVGHANVDVLKTPWAEVDLAGLVGVDESNVEVGLVAVVYRGIAAHAISNATTTTAATISA